MKTTFISKENNEVKFTLDFTAEEFENAQIKAYQKTKDKFSVDGFRPGKAPRKMIENKYGEGIFVEDAIDELFAQFYPQAIGELNLEPVDAPKAEFGKIEKNQPLTITLTVPCFPVIDVKDYKGVKIEKIENEVKAEDVDKEIESMQKRNGRTVVVERPAENGDTVLLDYAGFVGEEQFEGGTAENQSLTLGSGMFIPGFEDQLVGVSAGESKDVVVTFPEEYQAAELAGKEAVFHCLVHEVSEEQLPELDDEFAKDVSEFDTLDELKASVKERLEGYAKEASVSQMKDAGISKVVEANEVKVPTSMTEDEIERMINDLNQQLSYQGMSIQQYLQFTGSDMDALKNEIRPDAEKQVKARIILRSIAEAEKFSVADEEIDAELETMAKQYKTDLAQIKEMIGEDNLQYFKKDMLIRKAIDFIYDNAEITESAEK